MAVPAPSPELRTSRIALAVSFCAQGLSFGLLVTRIPAIQDQYRISDAVLPIFLAAVPILAGVGSITTDQLVRRIRPRQVLRWAQPVLCLALAGTGFGGTLPEAAISLAAFGLAVGCLDASQNMLGVNLQHQYGRSIMLGFHAAFALGGILGASWAWAGAHWHLHLSLLFGVVAALVIPVCLVASLKYPSPSAEQAAQIQAAASEKIPWKPLLPLCAAMTFAYIGDSTVSNWSAKYLQDALHSSDQLSTVPYNAYMVTVLLGRAFGDRAVRRVGPVWVVRGGAVLAVAGFAVVATAPGAWFGIVGFVVLGLGISVLVPQIFASGGQRFPGRSDTAVARLNVFNYVGFLVGSPLVGAIADGSGYRVAMIVPLLLVGGVLLIAGSFAPSGARGSSDYAPPPRVRG
ncbi:MFS transporter [Mangrovactinospora gilvigrisea]|uniref:MFS transporter n=1 Tax=Mangrovactinospora gilvigrisea TaxID=1428644 RepID=A0A1J7BBJ2_9ACTN|nr:MFS transporter [Mangrovactinospora gilvigrisea]OIV35998.1 MFS transporter [Mangrovactinospora gilvigrisea]